jgi:hypothetical protein
MWSAVDYDLEEFAGRIFSLDFSLLIHYNDQQKRLDGRTTLKEFLIPVSFLAFWIYITIQSNTPILYSDAVYDLRNLPPLSSKGEWGIFQTIDDDTIDVSMFVLSKTLFYSPNNHDGVNQLMADLAATYPQIELHGEKSAHEVSLEYEANLFTTWAAIQFDLSDEQISTGKLIPSTTSLSTVNYEIRISPTEEVVLNSPPKTSDSNLRTLPFIIDSAELSI